MADKNILAATSAQNLVANLLNKPTAKDQSPESPKTVKEAVNSTEVEAPKQPLKPTAPDSKPEPVPIKQENNNSDILMEENRPIPVKINNSDILMEENLRAFSEQIHKWQDATLKLTADGKLTKDKEPIELSPFFNVGSSHIINVPGAFNLDTYSESEYRPGNLFATRVAENAEKWIEVLKYTCYQKLVANKHHHPVDEIVRKKDCRICGTKPQDSYYPDGHACLFCKEGEYEVCRECHDKVEKVPKDLIVESPHHPHKLMVCETGRNLLSAYLVKDKSAKCNHCGKAAGGRYYYCPRCEYNECASCALPAPGTPDPAIGDAPMQLQVDLLKDYLKSEKPNHYELTVKEGQRMPNRLSVVTNKPWDLSSIDTCQPNAYFEVTFENFSEESLVAVGVGNQIFAPNKPLGDQQNSFGYFFNGQATMNSYYSNEEGFPKYTKGDTIGVGIMLDSYNDRKLYYTKNGQFLQCFPTRVHRGMDCFPGVSFNSNSEAEFAVNFTGPFKFDVNSIPNYRNDRACRVERAPLEVIAEIFTYAAENVPQVCEWRTLSKKMNEAASHNTVWRNMYMRAYPTQNANLKIKSWFKFYKRRVEASNEPAGPFEMVGSKPMIIENCDFEFECPLLFHQLQGNESNYNERSCNKCNKTVYQVYGERQLKEYIQMGRCVTLYNSSGMGLEPPRMGARVAPRPPMPLPF